MEQIYEFHVADLSVELTMLVFAVILGFVQVFLAGNLSTRERGTAWNVGPRDVTPPLKSKYAGRVDRALKNFMETFPFFAVAVIVAHLLGRHDWMTIWGTQLYVAARIIYVPLYAFGVSGLRSLAFLASFAGIVLILVAILAH